MEDCTETGEDYRIAFFTNTYLPFVGGVAHSVELYRRYLKKLGYRVTVYAPQYEGEHEDSEDVRRLPAITQFNKTDFSLPLPLTWKPLLDFRQEAFDVVHVHHPFLLGEVGLRMARQYHLPLVFTYHTQYEQYAHYVPLDNETARRTIVRHSTEFCNLCDLVIAPTKDIRDLLLSRGVKARVEVLPTGIDFETRGSPDPQAFRKELGMDGDSPLLLHAGRLASEKNLEYLLSAGLEVLEETPRAHLAVVGEGESQAQLKDLALRNPVLGKRIHYTGLLTGPALVNAYAAADLFVFSSKTETQGMVLIEAMAGSTPVIALEATGVRGLVRDGSNGRLLPEDASVSEFSRAVLDALSNPERRKEWAQAALATAKEYDMAILAKGLRQFYRSLKLLPNHRLNAETMSFGLIRNYFETVREDVVTWFASL